MERRSFSKKSIDKISQSSLVKKLKNEKDRLIVNYDKNIGDYKILGVALEFNSYISAKGFDKASFDKSLLEEFIDPKFLNILPFWIDPTNLLKKLNNCMEMIKESLDKENNYEITVYYNPSITKPKEQIKKFKDCVLRFYDIDLNKTKVKIKASI